MIDSEHHYPSIQIYEMYWKIVVGSCSEPKGCVCVLLPWPWVKSLSPFQLFFLLSSSCPTLSLYIYISLIHSIWYYMEMIRYCISDGSIVYSYRLGMDEKKMPVTHPFLKTPPPVTCHQCKETHTHTLIYVHCEIIPYMLWNLKFLKWFGSDIVESWKTECL